MKPRLPQMAKLPRAPVNDELPPHSPEAERGVLGSILIDPTKLRDAHNAGCTTGWFYDLKHQEIFQTIEQISKTGAVDLVTVCSALRDSGKLESVGGPAYVDGLSDDVPSAANIGYWLEILREKYFLRVGAGALARAQGCLKDITVPAKQRLADIATALETVQTVLTGQRLELVTKLSDLPSKQRSDPGELLKYRYLCRSGGLLMCGPTGIGKSSLAMQCMILWAIERPAFGITPAQPLRSLLVQAENDPGDLGEMRDGVIAGLGLSDADAQQAYERILTFREDSRTAGRFFSEVIEPLLSEHRPDLLWIDPALAYLGGEANAQKDVGAFLRNGLNPLLHKYDCGCVVVHHTNKPLTGREKVEWAGSDLAYLGSGSAEWANWARAVLAVRATGQQGTFELCAGKRGSRLGWKDDADCTAYTKFIAHANEPGVICWREAAGCDIAQGGRPGDHNPAELLALLPLDGLKTTEWKNIAKEECGISERSFYRLKRSLESQTKVLKSKINQKWQPITQ